MSDIVQHLFGIAGRTAVVTGGSRGIGRMIAEGYVKAGARVYITARKAQECEQTARDLSAFGECIAIPGDLSTQDGCQSFARAVSEREERLDILVNNAGATWGAPIEEYPDAAWDKVLGVNVKGVFFLTTALLPALRAAGTADEPARVINVGSIDGIQVPLLETYAYSSSKAAVHQLTRHLAKRLAAEHITVNAIAPGPFPSKMMAATLEHFSDEILARVPLGRIGVPDDMAGVALYLASRAAAYVTGAIIPVDGGSATTK